MQVKEHVTVTLEHSEAVMLFSTFRSDNRLKKSPSPGKVIQCLLEYTIVLHSTDADNAAIVSSSLLPLACEKVCLSRWKEKDWYEYCKPCTSFQDKETNLPKSAQVYIAAEDLY